MKIYRDGKEIELTSSECYQAYREVRHECLMDDIGEKLREDYDIEPCTDDSIIDLEELATQAYDLLCDNDTLNDIYWDTIHTTISGYLKERRN